MIPLFKKSREVAVSLPCRFPSRRCSTLYITMEVEPSMAKQYKCHHCCSCKNYRGKGMEGGGKKRVVFFLTRLKITSLWKLKMRFGASYSTSNNLLLVARHNLTMGLPKCLKSWRCKIRKFTVAAFHCEESTHLK